MGVKHECEQPLGLWLCGREFGRHAAEPDRLLSEIAAVRVVREGLRPAVGEGGVYRLQHRAEPLGQVLALGDPERNAGKPDLRLGAG